MSNQSKLIESNSQLGLQSGIYQNTAELFRDSRLSNYIRIAVDHIFSGVNDKSLFSLDIENAIDTDQLTDALSSSRFNFLRSLDFAKINTALDLSEDFGGVAHYLADQVNTVDAVKIDPDLARLSATRCAAKHNVYHISEDIEKLSFPHNHYDLIVIGQLEALQLTPEAQAALLCKLQAALSSQGVLILNAKNKSRLSKWFDGSAGVNDDAIAYRDLYYSNKNADITIEQDRKSLLRSLLTANFSTVDFYATFSNGDDCSNLFSADYLMACPDGLNQFYRLGSIKNPEINEYLLYKKRVAEKQNLTDSASRYLVLAANSLINTRQVLDKDFCHFPGTGRQPQWRTVTSRERSAELVQKTAAYPELAPAAHAKQALITQNLDPRPYYKGRMLIDDWLQAMLNKDYDNFKKHFEEYSDWLNDFAQTDPSQFAKTAYDLLPFNIILNEGNGQQTFRPIDTEWQLNRDFGVGFVLFRALFWFAFENKTLLRAYATDHDFFSIGSFIVRHLPDIYEVDDLKRFVELEEQIQADINNHYATDAVANILLQSFDNTETAIDKPPTLRVAWGTSDGSIDKQNSISRAWRESSDTQIININLPAFNATQPVLRLDPIESTSAFEFRRIQLTDSKNKVIWSLNTSADIFNSAQTHNAELSDTTVLALNNDPHFLFDLGSINNVDSATKLEVELAWVRRIDYNAALRNLTGVINNRNTVLTNYTHRLNEYRADISYKAQRIEDLLGHRSDLSEMLKKAEANITELNTKLRVEHRRNNELHHYLLMRPSTRAKRVTRRLIDRLANRPAIEEKPKEPESAVQSPAPVKELLGQNTENYQQWVAENTLNETQIVAAKTAIDNMQVKPVFSILVPIYNTDPEYLIPMIRSVQNQIYPHWQLCLVDDCSPKSYLKRILEHEAANDERISIQLNNTNQGISVTTNDALALATGDYIALLDHDDEISIDALFENAKVINAEPQAGLIYSDEDKLDMQGQRLEPYFKPDYSPDLLNTNNYICHFTVIKKSIADQIGGFRDGLDGSQDHDIILRAATMAEKIVHIPKILYHWRKIPGSTAVTYDSKSYAWEAGRKAVEDNLNQHETGVSVKFGTLKGTYRVYREIKGEPLVSIIIPFKDKPELLDSCLHSILNRTSYRNFEIIGVNNNSEQAQTFERIEHFKKADERITFVEKNIPFNFSEICNYGVKQAKGDYVILLNNDIEIISPDWIEQMLEHAQRDEIGAVGGKLLYPDGRIQHAGVVVGMVGAAGHPHKFFPDNHIGYHGRLHMVYNVSAVTGAMMMMRTEKYHQVGGLDAENLAVAYNDIDLCLKLMDQGYINLFTPHAKATHHESISRGYEDTDEKMQRLLKEQEFFLTKWADFMAKGDPYYNPNLSLKNERFSLRFKD